MKFYKLSEVPTGNDDRVFKSSSVSLFCWTFVFLGGAVALPALRIAGVASFRHAPLIFICVFAAFFALFGWISAKGWRASLRPGNWLVRANERGIVVNYRSFLNWRLPAEDFQAVGFDWSEIASVRVVKERRISPSLGEQRGSQMQFLTFLEFGLTGVDLAALERQLQAEQRIETSGMIIFRDCPVEVLPGGVVRVRWTGGEARIRPGPAEAMKYFGQRVRIDVPVKTTQDLPHQPGAAPGTEDAKISALLRGGDQLGAISLARQTYGCSLVEARQFVDKLQSNT